MTEGLSAAIASMPVRKPREERDAQEPSMFALLAAGTYNRGARQPAPASRGKVPAIPDLSRRRFLTISAAATLAGVAAVATSACASHTRGGTEMPSRILRGVTVDSLDDIEETAAVLSSSANRLTVRLIMDSERPLEDCARAVAALKPHADIMIQVIDSTDLPDRSASWIAKRTQDAMDAFGDDVALWEIGNELNGSWAGSSPSQINTKARAAYDVVRAAGGRTAVTFNYWSSHDCYDQPWEATLPYARQAAASVPDVDCVFLSVYETACSPAQHPSAEELASALNSLGDIYPDACLGIGEIGAQGVDDGLASNPSMPEKERLATYYYGLHDNIAAQVGPRYVGGYFWWYFYEDAVDEPEGSSLWPTLDALLNDL